MLNMINIYYKYLGSGTYCKVSKGPVADLAGGASAYPAPQPPRGHAYDFERVLSCNIVLGKKI